MSFKSLQEALSSLPEEITKGVHTTEEEKAETAPEPEEAEETGPKEADGENWGADSEDDEEAEEEEAPKQTANQQQFKQGSGARRKPGQKHKQKEDDDGFVMVKDQRYYNARRGKRGGRGRGGYKARGKYHGPKPHVERAPKTSHGKRPNWQKGEKRGVPAEE